MATLTTLYCTDEALAIRASGDFAVLCPKDQTVAKGLDGVFSGLDRWTLTSATVDFQACGVVPGMILQATKTGLFLGTEELAVAAVAPNAVTLKRKGLVAGLGQPPGAIGGSAGVGFLVATLLPQIEKTSYDLNRRYSLDDLITLRRTSDLYDIREIEDACVLETLANQYEAMARNAGESTDHFARQAKAFAADAASLISRTALHWKPVVQGGPDRTSNPFSMHIVR